MAIQISGTNVIDNSRNLTNIVGFTSTVNSVWSTITNNQTTSKTLVNREFVSVTGSGLTMTLPANPSAGWEVAIQVGNFTNTNIARNGQNIMGLAEDMTIDITEITANLLYTDSTRGWRII